MITKKEIKEKYNGVYTFEHIDSFGTRFKLSIFTIGNVVSVYVYRGDTLVFHRQSCVYKKFRQAAMLFENTKEWIVNEKDHRAMHEDLGSDEPTSYVSIRDNVQDWVKNNKRPMNIADAQAIARKYKDKSKAMNMIYTAACAIANDPANCTFRERYNFSVQFSL